MSACAFLPLLALASETFWSFTAARMSNPNTAGIYWNHSTSHDGDLEVIAAVVNHDGNVIEKVTFDENGESQSGVNASGNQSLAEYVESTISIPGGTTNGFYGGFGNDSDFCMGFNCNNDPFSTTGWSAGGM